MRFGINYVGAGKTLYDSKNLYATLESAGFDLKADLSTGVKIFDAENRVSEEVTELDALVLFGGQRALIKTGIRVALPHGTEMQVRSRSGLALKNGIVVANSPGTVDSDYAHEVGVILLNTSRQQFVINHGDRIAQAIVVDLPRINAYEISDAYFAQVHEAKNSNRTGGFGSTGTK